MYTAHLLEYTRTAFQADTTCLHCCGLLAPKTELEPGEVPKTRSHRAVLHLAGGNVFSVPLRP